MQHVQPPAQGYRYAAPPTSMSTGAKVGIGIAIGISGFLVIAILAAIAIPVFLNQRQKGWDAAVQSDLRNAATAQETFLTEGQPGSYVNDTVAGALTPPSTAIEELEKSGFKFSSAANYDSNLATMDVYAVGGNAYCMVAQSQSGGYFWYDSFTGPGKSTGATATSPTTGGAGTAVDPICDAA